MQRSLIVAVVAAGVAMLATTSLYGVVIPGSVTQGADTTITIRASSSTLEFNPTRVSAKAGTRVRIRFVNDGTLPHNLVLPKKDDDIDALALAAYQAGETGYVPMGMKDRLLSWTTLASPGESVEATFVVPAAGEYTYVCLFPGHANSMLGTLRALK
jgi:plastocyanin